MTKIDPATPYSGQEIGPGVIDKIAWLHLVDGLILSTRSRGKEVYYLPGGKREAGETDAQTLVREVREEVAVEITEPTITPAGVFEAQADGKAAGVVVRMTCFTAEYTGTLTASSEIEEIAWLGYADRDRVSAVDKLIFDHLHETGQLR